MTIIFTEPFIDPKVADLADDPGISTGPSWIRSESQIRLFQGFTPHKEQTTLTP